MLDTSDKLFSILRNTSGVSLSTATIVIDFVIPEFAPANDNVVEPALLIDSVPSADNVALVESDDDVSIASV
ncbi:Uncharacterised protein [Yersinia pseudotuberculosis]|nr:Uncharacterised protein [Yersinia pseudotuberculosis]